MDHDIESTPTQTRLFTLRIWPVESGAATQWRARLQDVRNGEVTYCTNWDSLITCIEESLREKDDKSATDGQRRLTEPNKT